MVMRTRKRHATQASMWVATQDSAAQCRTSVRLLLNQILEHDFDGDTEHQCQRFDADDGRACHSAAILACC